MREFRKDYILNRWVLINTDRSRRPRDYKKVKEKVEKGICAFCPGYETLTPPEIYRVEDRYLNMKGKKLAPLRTEEVRLILRPMAKGTFNLNPRIMYLDETGKNKSHEPEPVTITVKELGLRGWIRGE